MEADFPIGDGCRQLGVSEDAFYVREKRYVHLSAATTVGFGR